MAGRASARPESSRAVRRRAARAPSHDDDDARDPGPTGSPVEWAGPSRRARAAAVLIAVVFAAATFAVVSRVWRQAAPPTHPVAVVVKLVATPLPAVPVPGPAPSR